MKLNIKHFMCWDDYELTLEPGIVLLEGASGSGKTTLFKAIAWCLYGRIRKVNPKKNENAKTFVSLSFENYYIERQKKPSSLIFKTKEKIYEDTVAQEQIEKTFGTYNIWWAGCYATQRTFNHFLEVSVKEKMEMIHEIAFHDTNPTFYIQKMEGKLKEVYTKITLLEQQLCTEEKIFQFKFNTVPSSLNSSNADQGSVNIESKDVIQKELNNIEKQIIILENQKNKYIEYQAIKSTLEKDFSNLKIKIDKLQQQKSTFISQLENQSNDKSNSSSRNSILSTLNSSDKSLTALDLSTLNSSEKEMYSFFIKTHFYKNETDLIQYYQNQLKNYEIKSKLKTLESYKYNKQYTQDDYNQIVILESRIKQLKQKCKTLSIPYNISISELKQNITTMIKTKQYYEYQHKLNHINKELEACIEKSLPSEPIENDTLSFTTQLEHYQKEWTTLDLNIKNATMQQESLPCPECGVSLIYKPHQLTVCEIKESSTSLIMLEKQKTILEQKISKCKKDIVQYQNTYTSKMKYYKEQYHLIQKHNVSIKVKRETLLKELKSLAVIENPSTLIEDHRSLQSLLTIQSQINDVDYIDSPHPSSLDIIKNMEYYSLIKDFSDPLIDKKTFLTQYDMLQQQRTLLKNLELELETNLNNKTQIEQKLKSLEPIQDASKELKLFYEEKVKREKQLQNCVLMEQKLIEEEKIIKLKKELKEQKNYGENLSRIIYISHTTENEILENTIYSLNKTISDICKLMFNEDMIIDIKLFKEHVKNKEKKHSVVINIYHKGDHYEDSSELSIGEQDRLSLAFTLAFNQFSSFPCIILDECLASVEADIKDMIVDTIKTYTQDKIILCALHEAMEGGFDVIIPIHNN